MKNTGKRIVAWILALALLISCVPEFSADAYDYSDFYQGEYLIVTATDGVNMRDDSSASSNRITTIGYGNHVYVNYVLSNGWMNITCGGYTGFVEGDEGWFTPYDSDPTVYKYSNKQATVLANALNVHRAPVKLSTNILDDIYCGQVVDAIGYTNTGWTKISYYRNGKKIVGYVYSVWVKISAKSSSTSTSEKFSKIYGYSAAVKSSCEALNVHVSPSTSATIIEELYSGDVVSIQAQSKTWYRVTINTDGGTETGYIYRSYTDKVDAMANLRLCASGSSKTVKTKTLKVKKKVHLLVRGNTGMTLKVTWKSSNKKVATVSKRGYVTAKKKGTAKITCTIKVGKRTKKLTCKIKVKK